jgi:hypothetical protein
MSWNQTLPPLPPQTAPNQDRFGASCRSSCSRSSSASPATTRFSSSPGSRRNTPPTATPAAQYNGAPAVGARRHRRGDDHVLHLRRLHVHQRPDDQSNRMTNCSDAWPQRTQSGTPSSLIGGRPARFPRSVGGRVDRLKGRPRPASKELGWAQARHQAGERSSPDHGDSRDRDTAAWNS